MNSLPIGEFKTRIDVYCEICGGKRTRKLSMLIYNINEIEASKMKNLKTKEKYTCRICKSILKDKG